VAEALVVLAVSEAVGLVEADNGEIKLKKPEVSFGFFSLNGCVKYEMPYCFINEVVSVFVLFITLM
jgi:hypothetical protein